ncbi:hydrogen peroxide-inducible genes activator [Alteromonas aestuariivivens]|uniref:Hydrogen peroxide-inducible genes activator n=1 Tax=Alteromonas aestuariivivens TaxID=1938339 RepID=A0A3D8M6D9_9ALTE|nr:hydrogen peroxide-inducible genes activator [Alteromonas aestuariivivens]RDV25104.1 hydrogen peroxide-inducible genes activator [Alteromonas aestuariivivens]
MQHTGKMPSLNQIRYFMTVAKHLNFRRAAQLLGISQPTLTAQINALETSLGLTLFERSRSGTFLSPQGQALLHSAEDMLGASLRFIEEARSLSEGENTTYRLGIPPTLGPYLLPHILPEIHRLKPGLKFYVREAAPANLQQGLLAGEYDLILSPLSSKSSQIQVQPLFLEPLKFVMPSDHPLAGDSYIDPEKIRGEKVLTLEDRHHFHYQVQEICTQLGVKIDRDYEGTSLDTLRQMVVMGMGVAFLPGLYVHSELHDPEALHVCELADMPIVRQHLLAWRNTAPARTFFRELASLIRQITQDKLSSSVMVTDMSSV